APGTYFVQEVVPSGYLQTGGNAGYVIIVGSGINSGGTSTGNNFDNSKVACISGTKYLDITGNGLTGDDTPLGGVTINLYRDTNPDGVLTAADGGPVATTVTASGTGTYSFANLLAGKYFVQEVVPTGYVRTYPTLTDTYTVNAAAGSSTTGLN